MGTSTKGEYSALMAALSKDKQVEVAFITVFSVLILGIFYVVISMNGVVLGNDPAVHLEKAQIFLNTGHISLANLGWTPPLYQIVLAMVISLSGAVEIGQYIFLVRALTVVLDWLLFMSVYLVGSKFFSKKVGATAAILLLMCFPVYEANQFGGYTTVLALAFMLLVLLYTPLAVDKLGYLVVAFFAAFGLVLSHQLAAFLAIFIMPPILLYMLIKSKGKNIKVVLALALGGGIAFFLYYFQAMMEKEPPEPENPLGIVVIGNIEPDMHDTAKEAVRRSLKRAGFKTIDVGKSVAPQVFIDKVKENNANVIAISVNTVPAKNNLAKLDELLKAAGLKEKVGIIMGGAAVKKEDADAIGALFGKNKEEAPELAKKAIKK